MQPQIYLICIVIGLISSLSYFYFTHKFPEYAYSHKLIFFLILFVLLFELYAYYLVTQKRSNVLVYNISFIYLETVIILSYFIMIFNSKKSNHFILYYGLLFLMWGAVNSVFIQDMTVLFQQYSYMLGVLGILILCIRFLFATFNFQKFRDQHFFVIPHFWNVSAIFMFYSTSFIYFISLNLTGELEMRLIHFLGSVNRIFAAGLYLVLGFSFYSPLIFKNPNGRKFI